MIRRHASRLWAWIVRHLERAYRPDTDMRPVSLTHLYDINAAMSRNYWYDKRGQRWPLRDAL